MKRLVIRLTILASLAAALVCVWALPRLGAWLVVEDSLVKADAILVLGGTRFERPLEAVDLYHEGWAPTVLLIRQLSDWGELALVERGVVFPRESDMQVEVMTRLGVPHSAIEILDEEGSTAEEAETLFKLATARRLSRVIVVTSKQHTRRAGLVMRRRLRDTGTEVLVRSSRYDRADVEHWWRSRATLRFTLFEWQRYFGYWIGVAD